MKDDMRRIDPDIPDPVESRRASSGRIVRFIYGVSVLALVAFVVIRFGGPLVYLSGPGIVSAPRLIVSHPVVVRVDNVAVEPGDRVEEDDIIATVQSPQVDETVSTLMQALSDVTGRQADLQMRVSIAANSIDAAQARLEVAEESIQRFEQSPSSVSGSVIFRQQIYRERAEARQVLAALQAEASEGQAQIDRLVGTQRRLEDEIERVRSSFDEGRVLAPASGIVSERLAHEGETVVTGSPIAEIMVDNAAYIDWYLPNFRLVEPQVGQHAFVIFGQARLSGTIEAILPIAEVYRHQPTSFIASSQLGQVARVRLDRPEQRLALGSAVRVRMYYIELLDHFWSGVVRTLHLDNGHAD